MTDDAELLRRYADDRSEAAFAELVGRHVDLVYSSALRQCRGDHHRAQEVTQMVFADLARKASSLVRHPVLLAWLHRSSHLAALDLFRREGRRQRYERAAGGEAGIAAPAGDAVIWEEVGPVLDEAIDALDECDRQAVLLRYFGDRPYAEVGRRLRLSENAARMRVDRALEKLHGILARRGITSPAAALAAALSGGAVTAAPSGVAIASTSAAMSAAGGAGVAWLTFMTSTKLPIALSAAVLIGSATLVTMKESAAQKAAIEAAELSMQNRSISSLESQNKSLSLAASRAGGFQDDDSKISIVQRQVKDLESKADDRRALAIARQKAFRKTNQDDASPESESARIQKQPKLLTQVRPEYPAEMRTSGTSGEVMVDLIVDKNGVVQNAFALSSTDKAFADAAVSAVSQWTFEPGLANGHAVFTHLQIPIVFTPSADAPAPTAGTWF